jgi:hypothetical protein
LRGQVDIKSISGRQTRNAADFSYGLSRAPQLEVLGIASDASASALTVGNVGAIVVPATALGGVPALAAEFHAIPLIAVRENDTVLAMTADRLSMSGVIEVGSYLEATGVVTALRHGIALESLRRPIHRVDVLTTLAESKRRAN